MRYYRFAICLVVAVAGCGEANREIPQPSSGMSSADIEAAFGSREALTKALEARWPVSAIKEFCIPERRHDLESQNLVTDSDVKWEEDLYPNSDTGFDRIYWYANVELGRVTMYSLNARRGHDTWLLEIGGKELIQKMPEVTPDPKRPGFVGSPEASVREK